MRILILGYQGGDIGSWRQSADPSGSALGSGFNILESNLVILFREVVKKNVYFTVRLTVWMSTKGEHLQK